MLAELIARMAKCANDDQRNNIRQALLLLEYLYSLQAGSQYARN
jgi:hypothetical protein